MTPRLLSRTAAAEYVGLSPNSFDARVKDDSLPQPIRLGKRTLYDLKALNAKLDIISGLTPSSSTTDEIMEYINGLDTNEIP